MKIGSGTDVWIQGYDNFSVLLGAGFRGHCGSSGTNVGNVMNFNWTSTQLDAWVDTTNVGQVTLTSDYRIKQCVSTQTACSLSKVKSLNPVDYQYKDFCLGTTQLAKADGVTRQGFLAHELATVIPSAVNGTKDSSNQLQSLKLDAVVSVLTKALQEAVDKIEVLEAKVAALESA